MSSLNAPKVSPFTKEIGSKLRLDSSFINFVFSKERPTCFRYWCGDADNGWTCYVPDDVIVAYPLWSIWSDQALLLVSVSEISFARGFPDEPAVHIISKSSQGLLANLLRQIWESEISETEINEAAQFCGFRYLDDLLIFLNAPPETEDGVSWDDRWKAFIADIDSRSRG